MLLSLEDWIFLLFGKVVKLCVSEINDKEKCQIYKNIQYHETEGSFFACNTDTCISSLKHVLMKQAS
jgi:hypothetical protein